MKFESIITAITWLYDQKRIIGPMSENLSRYLTTTILMLIKALSFNHHDQNLGISPQ